MSKPWVRSFVIVGFLGIAGYLAYHSDLWKGDTGSREQSAAPLGVHDSGASAKVDDSSERSWISTVFDRSRPTRQPSPTSSGDAKKVITEYKIIPSSVGGVIALDLGEGKRFMSSISDLNYAPCSKAERVLCILHANRRIKVNQELREMLPFYVDYHVIYPGGHSLPK